MPWGLINPSLLLQPMKLTSLGRRWLVTGSLLLLASSVVATGKPSKQPTRHFKHGTSFNAREVAEVQAHADKKPDEENEELPYWWLNRTVKQYNGRIEPDRFTRYFTPTPRDLTRPPGR